MKEEETHLHKYLEAVEEIDRRIFFLKQNPFWTIVEADLSKQLKEFEDLKINLYKELSESNKKKINLKLLKGGFNK